MAIQDAAGNAIAGGTTGKVLGFLEPAEAAEALPLDMYRFLLEPIRSADLSDGALFAKRFLDGPQQFWKDTQARIFALKDIHNITKAPDGLLTYLKSLLGWTPDLDHITSDLDNLTLRRLIAASAPLWKQRGTEDALANVLRLTTGARLRIYNWFDFRWVLDETVITEEHEGLDAYMISLPSEGDDDHRSNVRIVDDGTLNRALVEGLVRLMRASGERWEVSYLHFLDQFTVDSDNSQWSAAVGTLGTVSGGKMTLGANMVARTTLVPIASSAADWQNYVGYAKVRRNASSAQKIGVVYNFVDANNWYSFGLDIPNNRVYWSKVVGGVETESGFASFAPYGTLVDSKYYGVRVAIQRVANKNEVQCYLDGELLFTHSDPDGSAPLKGKFGVTCESGAASMDLSEAEVFSLPLDTTTIDINT